MARMLAMFRIQVIQTVRDRGELVSILVLPLLLTWVFGVAFGSQGADRPVEVLWLDGDTGLHAEHIKTIAAEEPSITLVDATREEAEVALDEGTAALAVFVPEGFSDEVAAGGSAAHTPAACDVTINASIANVTPGRLGQFRFMAFLPIGRLT